MSEIRFARTWIPEETTPAQTLTSASLGPESALPNTKAILIETNDIKLPDPRAVRSMTRAAALMSHVAMSTKEFIDPVLAKDPFMVGIYCAVENGPIDYPSTQQLIHQGREDFGEKYKKARNPKMYLKQLPNLASAQLGIFLNIMGPMNVYSHSTEGGIQALDQAEFDLEHGIVDAALVCSGFSFEDHLLTMRHARRSQGSRVLSEGAAVLVLTKGKGRTDWIARAKELDHKGYFFGVSQQIVSLAINGGTSHGN